jgi:hypothetical protein
MLIAAPVIENATPDAAFGEDRACAFEPVLPLELFAIEEEADRAISRDSASRHIQFGSPLAVESDDDLGADPSIAGLDRNGVPASQPLAGIVSRQPDSPPPRGRELMTTSRPAGLKIPIPADPRAVRHRRPSQSDRATR